MICTRVACFAVACFVSGCAPAPRPPEHPRAVEVAPDIAAAAAETVARSAIARRAPGTITIATWNIENFSSRKIANQGVLAAIVRTVRRYDVVAIEEVSDAEGRLPDPFLDALNAPRGADYSYVVSERTGQQPDDAGPGVEQYGFWWNTERIELLDEGELFPDDEEDLFAREPFAARFRATDGEFSFVLIAIHTKPEVAVAEIDALHRAVGWAQSRWTDEEHFIVLGDFNAGCRYASPRRLAPLTIRGDAYTWIVPDDAATSLAGCAHDRIVSTTETDAFFAGRWGVDDDAFDPGRLDVSDHWPVWAAFRIRSR